MRRLHVQQAALYTTVVVLVFIFTAMVFVSTTVSRTEASRQGDGDGEANAIVSSLSPSNVRDRILKDAEEQAEQDMLNNKKGFRCTEEQAQDFPRRRQWRERRPSIRNRSLIFSSHYGHVWDIVGFTAWSSVREPSQVFTLLETVYHAFDEIAKRRRVFKVETIGDCYVCHGTTRSERKDHAVMARFSRDALNKMNDLTKRLEVSLGPDTGDLSMRFDFTVAL
jgi:hypothetical protein